MRYKGNVIRPPSEADSLILQITYGCSHNRCTFCPTYKNIPFRLRSLNEIDEDLTDVGFESRRIFLCDGDPLVTAFDRLVTIFDLINSRFPDLNRIGAYANARSLLLRTPEEMNILRAKKLKIIYLGLESGDDEILSRVKKGATADEMVSAAARVKEAGIKLSVMALNGIAGTDLSVRHAEKTGKILSLMDADYISLLTVMPVPGTAFYDDVSSGRLKLPEPMDILREIKVMLENLETERGLFFANHASNYLPLQGKLPGEKEKMIELLNSVIKSNRSDFLKAEFLRGL